MEMEFKDTNRRRRFLTLTLGVALAVIAGVAAYQIGSQGAGAQARVPMRSVVVAVVDIPARTVIESSQLTIRELPEDGLVSQAITDPTTVIGLVTAVRVYANQPLSPNLLASASANAPFSITDPDEVITEESPYWRAVSVAIPNERAVGGEIIAGQRVDLIVSLQLDILTYDPEEDEWSANPTSEGLHSGRSTKIIFTDLNVLERKTDTDFYVLKVDLSQAEAIAHLQSDGAASFSLALRPDGDTRGVNPYTYGETLQRIVEQYGFPVPEVIDLELLLQLYEHGVLPPAQTPAPGASPGPNPTPAPSTEPSESPAPSTSPAP
jgi:Flp pilus assembly protein CpaB